VSKPVAAQVAIIRLDRSAKGNALSAALVDDLAGKLQSALADPAVHTVAFTAEGRNFCTGFDLSDLDETTDAQLLRRFIRVEQLLDAIWRSPVRTVALAQGRAWGAGADLFAACDSRLATSDAEFRFPGAGFGLVLGTRRLAQRVGRDEARRLTCEGGSLNSASALEAGLVSALVPDAADETLLGHIQAPAADRATVAALRAATLAGDSDADLAALVRSAARPGLKERIIDYRGRRVSAVPAVAASA
jgi:enoyl-CoA hydratase/carnithine racemase